MGPSTGTRGTRQRFYPDTLRPKSFAFPCFFSGSIKRAENGIVPLCRRRSRNSNSENVVFKNLQSDNILHDLAASIKSNGHNRIKMKPPIREYFSHKK